MPKKVPDDARRERQITFRITESEYEVVRHAAHLERVGENAYLYEIVRLHISALRNNGSVMALLGVQERYDAEMADTLPMQRPRTSDVSTETEAEGN